MKPILAWILKLIKIVTFENRTKISDRKVVHRWITKKKKIIIIIFVYS